MSWRTIIAVTLTFTCSWSLARAQAPAAVKPVELTLEDALRAAQKHNRSLQGDRARLESAQSNIDQAWASLFPTLSAQGKYSRNYKQVALNFGGSELLLQPDNQLDVGISFHAPLLVPAAYPALDAVKAGARAAEANFQLSETMVLIAVAQAFYAAHIADEVLAARRSNIEAVRATLTNARTRFEAGTVTKVDVERAELASLRAEQMEREALYGRDRTYRGLATLIQARTPIVVKVVAHPPELHDENELEQALLRRPEYRALDASLKSALAQDKAQAWRMAPSVSAFGNARAFNYDNFARDRSSWVLGAQLDWLLYDGGARAAVRRGLSAQAAELVARAEVLRDTVRDELTDGRQQLGNKQQAVATAERSVALARSTLELVRVQYEAGQITQVDLLNAQDALVGAQEALSHAHFDLAAADLALRKAAGTFPPR